MKNYANYLVQITAIIYALICHGVFVVSGTLMCFTLFFGFSNQISSLEQYSGITLNIILLLQFPILHSFLLSQKGKFFLRLFYSKKFVGKLDTTIYATIASVQLFLLFFFWKPSGILLWKAEGIVYILLTLVYLLGWLLLTVSSFQAGLGVQTGALGWTSVFRNIDVKYPNMPNFGLFRIIRHPIYLSFSIILWSSPYFTVDKIILATIYTVYCVGAPLFKEKRFSAIYGEKFLEYKKSTPYFIPRLRNVFWKS
jgi:protein-S-isoprenylcysteine O-methyltransferase Ste14